MRIVFKLIFVCCLYCFSLNAISQDRIRLNQIGFYPNESKIAIVPGKSNAAVFRILSVNNKVVFEGKLSESALPALNGNHTQIADFSALKKAGQYQVEIDGLGKSYPFQIVDGVFEDLAKASIKAFYYQRASTALSEKYARKWHRDAGHPDDSVLVHPSAGSKSRPAGTIISASKGWYDAGDYNKYIVNSGISMGTLLSLYEDFPKYIKTQKLNIPESGNGIPDLLNEVIWNLRWMLAMQDPDDGGVYNKLTNAEFDGMTLMPADAEDKRYVVQKGTAATLDFAAVTAQAGRLLKDYDKQIPGLADSCLKASVKAWNWAVQYPDLAYDQTKMNQIYKPAIHTGFYGDRNFKDEWIWAAIELYLSTGEEQYYNFVTIFPDEAMPLPSWSNVRLLGYYSLIRKEKQLQGTALKDFAVLKKKMMNLADGFLKGADQSAYQMAFGKTAADFNWGSNSNIANQGIVFIQAYLLTADETYLKAAIHNMDYLLGRNALGYSYVTGFGVKSPMFPHHRPSVSDGIAEPVPGFLVGGPNPGEQDGVSLKSKIPDEAYVDDTKSFATNEIAINWNAPLAYLINAIEALKQQ